MPDGQARRATSRCSRGHLHVGRSPAILCGTSGTCVDVELVRLEVVGRLQAEPVESISFLLAVRICQAVHGDRLDSDCLTWNRGDDVDLDQ